MAVRNVVQRGYGAGASIAFVVTHGYSIGAGVASVDIGALALTELQVAVGGQVITITLQNDIWQAPGTAFDQVRQIILAGMNSVQSENTGWNKEVRDKQPITAVVRTSNTVVTVTLAAAPDYDITTAETIIVTVPAEALITSTTALVALSPIGVTADVAIVDTHVLRFSSATNFITFTSAPRRTTFQSVSNARIILKGTVQPLGFILVEDGAIITQENNLPIAKE